MATRSLPIRATSPRTFLRGLFRTGLSERGALLMNPLIAKQRIYDLSCHLGRNNFTGGSTSRQGICSNAIRLIFELDVTTCPCSQCVIVELLPIVPAIRNPPLHFRTEITDCNIPSTPMQLLRAYINIPSTLGAPVAPEHVDHDHIMVGLAGGTSRQRIFTFACGRARIVYMTGGIEPIRC